MKSTTRKSANPNKAKTQAARSGENGSTKTRKTTGVKAKPSAADGLRELFVAELKDIYWAEKALTKAIPKLIKNATAPKLVRALTEHLAATKAHVNRLTEVFSAIGEKAVAKKCEGMEGLIKEGDDIMKDTEKGVVRDAGIISAAQKVEHYEISSYGTLCAFAKTLGEHDSASILKETLDEEKEADATLSEIAESSVNEDAISSDEGSGKSSPRKQAKAQGKEKSSGNKSNGNGMSKGSGKKGNEQGVREEVKETSGKQTPEMLGSRKQTNEASSRMISKEMTSRNQARETSARNKANTEDLRSQVRNPRQK